MAVSAPLKPDPDARCPVCESADARLRYRITNFRVYDCRGCGLVYLWPQLDDDAVREMFSRLYTEGEGSVPELKTYYDFTYRDEPSNPLVQLYERWLDAIERRRPPGRLLDVGCGTGLFLAVARRRGWSAFGVDECEEATRHARDHFGLEVRVAPFSEVARAGEDFDAITMWDILEHARDPTAVLSDARDSLRRGGVIGLSTPNQRSILELVAGALYRSTAGRLTAPLEKLYLEQHFLYFTPRTLERALAAAGLDLRELRLETTDLRRLTLGPPMRLVLHVLFAVARITGLQNRMFALAGPRR